jgi:hypothetical protein
VLRGQERIAGGRAILIVQDQADGAVLCDRRHGEIPGQKEKNNAEWAHNENDLTSTLN